MEKVIRFSLLFFLPICSHIGETVTTKITFAAIGDFGGIPLPPYSTYTQKKIARVMGKFADTKQVQFIVGLGDNFYYEGVKNVDDHRFSSTFEHVYKYPALKTATWYMIAGNHDYGSNVSAQIAYTKRSKRWHFPHFFYTQGICLQLHSIRTRFVPGRGETKRRLKDRFNEHRRAVDKTNIKSKPTTVSEHFLSHSNHSHTDMQLIPLEKINSSRDSHIKEDQSNVHYIVTGNGNFYNSYMLHKRMLGNSLKFFHGNSGAFTLFEATPEVLKVFQIDEYGNEVYNTQLQPRTTIQSLNGAEDVLLDDFFTSQS
ncbi:unnamed protein product [Porites evermanni]|uniref:Calcineurin-like phosphoesterase domain-containing protein n=1 Tax=Porites evermanni TaxID=104178 RepID=A0ABN8MEE8_9CNID|nr:unnamed protein product [Porites evermanni]